MPKLKNDAPKQSFRDYVLEWNNRFPFDYIWRKKYNIPFGSPEHRGMYFFDMYIDWLEEVMVKGYRKSLEKKEDEAENVAIGLSENRKVVKMSEEEIDEDFKNLDLSSLSDNKDEEKLVL